MSRRVTPNQQLRNDSHALRLIRYVERNPLRANLVTDPLDWKYSSLCRRYKGTDKEKKILSKWPVNEPENYLDYLTQPESEEELEALRRSIKRGRPYGDSIWKLDMIKKYNLQSTLRNPGRPKAN